MTTALITREYNGNVFHFREDGYFNMTKAAKAFGKDVKDFWLNDSTKQYMESVAETPRTFPRVSEANQDGSQRRHLGTPQARCLLCPLCCVLRHGHRRHPYN